MPESIELSIALPASAKRIYDAWLDSAEHGAFTETECVIDPRVGGKFMAGDGYITGVTRVMEPYERIVQSWRTTDFLPDAPDSQLEVLLEEVDGGTKITLVHTNVPDGQGESYKQGWVEYYFDPMRGYFS